MKGGRKYGEGVYGTTYDFACQLHDNESFCKMIKDRRVTSVQLHSFDKMISLEKQSDIKRFIKLVSHLDCCVAKLFKNYMIGIDKKGFYEEINGMKVIYDIFGDKTEQETTLTSLKLMGFNFIAAYVIFEDNSHMYVTFTKKCSSDLEHTPMNEKKYTRLVQHILHTLTLMQAKNFAHCDLKPDNMIYCKKTNTFKLIDWGLSNFLEKGNRLVGTTMFGCPLSRYLNGMPAFLAVRILYLSTWKKNSDWFNSTIFQELYKMIYTEFMEVIKEDNLLQTYKYKFDLFGFGLSLAYLIHKHELNWKKHKQFIIKMISMKGFACARDAFEKI